MVKTFDIADIYPIQEISENCLINGNGDISFGYSLKLPEAYLVAPNTADRIHNVFVDILTKLPTGSTFQQINSYYIEEYLPTNIEGEVFLKRNHENYLRGRNQIMHDCDIYITVSNNHKVLGSPTQNSFMKMYNYVFNKRIKNIEVLVEKYKILANKVESSLKSIAAIKTKR